MNGFGTSVLTVSASIAVALLLIGNTWNTAQAAFFDETLDIQLFVGNSQTLLECDNDAIVRINSMSDSNPGIATTTEIDCVGNDEGLNLSCDGVGTTQIIVSGVAGTSLFLFPFTSTLNVTCSMFVVPESPIGIIALMGSSLAALGGFLVWKRRSNNSTDGMVGLGI